MKENIEIIYRYFLNQDGKVNKIPIREKRHREKLFNDIQKVYPGFMRGYSSIYGNPRGSDEAVHEVIKIFQNHRTNWFHKLKRKLTGS